MSGKNTIFINGHMMDAQTGRTFDIAVPAISRSGAPRPSSGKVMSDVGMVRRIAATNKPPVSETKPKAVTAPAVTAKPRAAAVPAKVHKKPQRSQTLLRSATKKPEPYVSKHQHSRSPLISKFGPQPKAAPLAAAPVSTPVATTEAQHSEAVPLSQSATARSVSHVPAAPVRTSSKQLKEQLIRQRLESADTAKKQPKAPNAFKRLAQKQPRAMSIVTMSMAFVVIGGYLAYINMPNLSVRVASMRAGVNASFPEYNPDGYHFNGPVAYTPGEVEIGFDSNTSDKGYTIKQRSSNWDSQAVLDNYVTKESDSYLTYSEQGLTIYTFDKKAAWVNRGVLYTIDGDAPLSSEQVLRIAASL